MRFNARKAHEGATIEHLFRKTAAVAVAAMLSLSFAPGSARAGDHEGRREDDARQSGSYESKIYGTVEKLPQDRIGTWIVNGREIVVTRDTRIKEKHGPAEAGAYVEAEGNTTGRTFIAYEIEVKQAKQGRR